MESTEEIKRLRDALEAIIEYCDETKEKNVSAALDTIQAKAQAALYQSWSNDAK